MSFSSKLGPPIVWTVNPDVDISTIMTWKTIFEKGGQKAIKEKESEWLKAIHPKDRKLTSELLSNAVKAKSSFVAHFRLQKDGGNYQQLSVKGFPLFDEKGNILQWAGTVHIIHKEIKKK